MPDLDSIANATNPKQGWIDFVLTQGPVTLLAVGGTAALYAGLFPRFELKEAVFGSSLLSLAALVDLFVWMVRRKEVVAEQKALWEALKAVDEKLKRIDAAAPTSRVKPVPDTPKVPSLNS